MQPFERTLLPRFIRKAGGGDVLDGHAAAAEKIAGGFRDKLALDRDALDALPLQLVRETAPELFWESERGLFPQ